MAGCSSLLTGIAIDCENVGGISAVYLAPITDVSEVTEVDGVITAITMVSTKKFAKYSFRRGTSQMTETGTIADAAGTAFINTEVSMKFAKRDVAKRKEMQQLLNSTTYAIVEDFNGIYWFLGYKSYCSPTALGGTSGTSRGDANEYTVTLSAETNNLPQTVSKAIVDGVI